ncbi:MAG: septal ring lytic transglycosylase RlpA family protein [Spirochaetales bacterium]|nr:septal ring lytic transglycosylase RlpA family protein [Spirochaetales bacterium]
MAYNLSRGHGIAVVPILIFYPDLSITKVMKLAFPLIFLIVSICCYAEETGYASWYGNKFHGRLTASGETYDMNKLTAAHKSLPFGTYVRVMNLMNGKSIVVKINDRGPFVKGRIIDLSRAAAEEIDMLGAGVVKVAVKKVAEKERTERYEIQVGSFSKEENARTVKTLLEEKGLAAGIVHAAGSYYRVLVGNIDEHSIKQTIGVLDELGFTDVLVRKKKLY